nr:class I SAM-dependent methyltransferase [uncultured Cetobacterium sp.]
MKNPKDGYNRWAKLYDKVEEKMPMGKFKKEAVDMLNGKILEVGVGSGANFKYYSKDKDIVGIDISDEMLKLATEKKSKLDLQNITLINMSVEEMTFEDNTFDSIISTCVFCTVPNPSKGLKEIYRVLKPGGQAIFLEHMKSSSKAINIFLWIMNNITKRLLGTSLLRETEKTIRSIGFSEVISKNIMMKDVLRLIIAKK